MRISPRHSPGANVVTQPNGWRLEIPAGGPTAYRFAQLDDHSNLPRRKFPFHPPVSMSLRARSSSNDIPGTWGFGFWNDPFGLSFGFGGNPLRLPTLPNAAWFFHASSENWLSFSGQPGNGFLAQVFCSRGICLPALAIPGILLLPFLFFKRTRIYLRKLVSQIVLDEGTRLDLDASLWHDYKLDWHTGRTTFQVDGQLVFQTTLHPKPPTGIVIWLDNQYAAFTPEGKAGYGVLMNEAAWLEMENLNIH